MTDLIKAIENDNFEQVKQLIAQGADVNEQGESGDYPITAAARGGVAQQIWDILIRNSANVNVAEPDGRTAIFIAVIEQDFEAVQSLVAAGADLNRFYDDFDDMNDKKTVLMFACQVGVIEIIGFLLKGGADPNQKSTKGNTALMFTASTRLTYQRNILVLLLQYGADPSLMNNQGQTAFDLCVYDDCKKILNLVEEPDDSEEPDDYSEDMEIDDEVSEDDPQTWIQEELFDYDKAVYSVAFSPEGTEFISGNTEMTLSHFFQRSDLVTRQPITEPFSTSVTEAVYTPDGQFVVLAAKRFGAVVKSRQQQDDVRFFNENGSEVTCVDVSPDSKKFLSASKDKIIRLWDIETGSLIRRFSDHKDDLSNIERVRFSPDGEHFASVADDIIIWSMAHGHMKTIQSNGEDKLVTFVYSPDGNRIASLTQDTCFVWNVKHSLDLAFALSGNGRVLTEVAYTPDGKYILLARDEDASGKNATINVCDANNGILISILDGGMYYIFSIAISSDNQFVLIGGMDEDEKGEVLFGKMSELLKPVIDNRQFPKELGQAQLKTERLRLTEEPDIFDALMAESYPLSEYQMENPDSIVFLINDKNGFGYDRDQLRSMTIDAQDYYFKCLDLNEQLVVALTKVAGETPYVLLRSAGTFYVPAEQLQAALDDDNHNVFMLKEYDVLPYTASIGVIEVSVATQRNYRGEQINVVSKDHCQSGSNKKAYEIIALDVTYT